MNRDDVTRWAREAGLEKYHLPDSMMEYEFDRCIERFAQAAYAAGAAAEQEKFAADLIEYGKAMAAVEREAFTKERQQYADWFDEAAADIADWGSYASEYFQNKHELDRNVQDFKNRAAAIRARGQK